MFSINTEYIVWKPIYTRLFKLNMFSVSEWFDFVFNLFSHLDHHKLITPWHLDAEPNRTQTFTNIYIYGSRQPFEMIKENRRPWLKKKIIERQFEIEWWKIYAQTDAEKKQQHRKKNKNELSINIATIKWTQLKYQDH